MKFPIILRELRKSQGYTQETLAKKLGISASAVGLYEQGRREPDNETLKKLSKIFNVSIDYLLGFEHFISAPTKQFYDGLPPQIQGIMTILNSGNVPESVIDYIYKSLEIYK